MKPVGNLDEYHPDVVAHCEQELLESLCLKRGPFPEYSAGDFCKPLYDVGDFRAEQVGYVLIGVVGVLFHVVKQRGAN